MQEMAPAAKLAWLFGIIALIVTIIAGSYLHSLGMGALVAFPFWVASAAFINVWFALKD